ncbi:acyl-CoA-binding domain-containing protein 5-like [Babylonia areolata]|uniref:acyl-CoA-binding domain-containing protein 5-like n=1 Tax=Babylonia areolata TaxID=304850 RepID=UPI003FD425AB
MAASTQEKFDAAVKVIRGLPKNGSFQPSNEMMLKFYAYYKQATEGPCTSPKPGIWNMVNRKKWEAWSELGPMDKEVAMLRYVEELKHIVEIMPQTEQVADFVDTLGSFYVVIEEGAKGSPVKKVKQPNGSAQLNGGGDEDEEEDDEAEVSEHRRLPAKNGENRGGDHGTPHSLQAVGPAFGGGVTTNGHTHKELTEVDDVDEEKDEEEEMDEDDDVEDTPQDSGSDGDEFCDTSDHVEQAMEAGASTSTSGRRLDNRVRFAPNPNVSATEDSVTSGYNGGSDLSAALRDMSCLSSQMEKERLTLWADSEFSFLPPASQFAPHHRSESLQVNASFSSLVSLAGSEGAPGRDEEELKDTSVLEEEAGEATGRERGYPMTTCRGGGDEGTHTPRSARPGGTGSSSSQGSRGGGGGAASRQSGDSGRRVLFPGAGSGGGRGGGRDRPMDSGGSVDTQILLTLLQLQQEMVGISGRLSALELSVKLQREEQAKKNQEESKWWPFKGLSTKWAIFLVAWPFITPVIINFLCRQRRSGPR